MNKINWGEIKSHWLVKFLLYAVFVIVIIPYSLGGIFHYYHLEPKLLLPVSIMIISFLIAGAANASSINDFLDNLNKYDDIAIDKKREMRRYNFINIILYLYIIAMVICMIIISVVLKIEFGIAIGLCVYISLFSTHMVYFIFAIITEKYKKTKNISELEKAKQPDFPEQPDKQKNTID